MWRFVLRRIATMVLIIFGVSLLIFYIISLTPGSPARSILGKNATPEQIEALNERLGYNKPVFQRYLSYMKGLLHGDFGTSYKTNKPVSKELFTRFKPTFILASFSIVFACIIGIPTGIISAVKQYSLIDSFCTITALVLSAIPGFWLGMMLMMIFAVNLRILPVGGVKTLDSYILPVFTLSVCHAAGIMRITRSAMLETVRMDYIRTARAKGASEKRVIIVHALKNALLPIITTIGKTFTIMLGGTIVIEILFTIPGIGDYLLSAILSRDVPVIVSTALVLAVISCVIVLLVDLLYAAIDPRIRGMYIKGED